MAVQRLADPRRWLFVVAALFVVATPVAARAQVPTTIGTVEVPEVEVPSVLPTPVTAPTLKDAPVVPDALPALPGSGEPVPEGSGPGGDGGAPAPGSSEPGPAAPPAGGGGSATELGSGTKTSNPARFAPGRPTKVLGGVVDEAYGTATGRALAKAAGRAMRLALPLAPPVMLAIVALFLIAAASRGADKLVRADASADRRVYRL